MCKPIRHRSPVRLWPAARPTRSGTGELVRAFLFHFIMRQLRRRTLYAGNLAGFFQHEAWVNPCIVPANTEEQMRARGAACGPDAAQNMTFFDLLADSDLYVGQM